MLFTSDWLSGLVFISLNCVWLVQSSALKIIKEAVTVDEELSFYVIELLEEHINKVITVISLLSLISPPPFPLQDDTTDRQTQAILKVLLTVTVLSSNENTLKFIQKSFLLSHHPSLGKCTLN